MLPPQGQAQECLLEKSMLDNRKSFLVARISAQVRFWGIFSVLNSCHSSVSAGWHLGTSCLGPAWHQHCPVASQRALSSPQLLQGRRKGGRFP